MKITNTKYTNLTLASEDDRMDNFWIDFVFSTILALFIIFLMHLSFFKSFLVFLVVRFCYYFTFEYLYGRTPGKYQTQTKVVTSKGGKPSIFQLFIRNIVRFISALSFASDDERAAHDIASNTFVIKGEELSFKKLKTSISIIGYIILFIMVTPMFIQFLSMLISKEFKVLLIFQLFLTLVFSVIVIQRLNKFSS